MAITFDAATTQQDNSTTTQTISYTCTGSDGLLLIGFITNNTTDKITGVTYNGVAMTRLQEQAGNDVPAYRSYVYGLLGPATGTHDIVVSASSASLIWTCVTSYAGVSQTGLPDAIVSGANDATTWTQAITTVADNSWVYAHLRAGATITFSSPDTLRCNAGQSWSGDSNGAVTPAGSYTINGTGPSDATASTKIVLSFAPSASASGPANLKSYNTNLAANIKSINGNLIANCKSLNTNV